MKRFFAALFIALGLAAAVAGVASASGDMTHNQPQASGDMTYD